MGCKRGLNSCNTLLGRIILHVHVQISTTPLPGYSHIFQHYLQHTYVCIHVRWDVREALDYGRGHNAHILYCIFQDKARSFKLCLIVAWGLVKHIEWWTKHETVVVKTIKMILFCIFLDVFAIYMCPLWNNYAHKMYWHLYNVHSGIILKPCSGFFEFNAPNKTFNEYFFSEMYNIMPTCCLQTVFICFKLQCTLPLLIQ